jgi:hypothetical protein
MGDGGSWGRGVCGIAVVLVWWVVRVGNRWLIVTIRSRMPCRWMRMVVVVVGKAGATLLAAAAQERCKRRRSEILWPVYWRAT